MHLVVQQKAINRVELKENRLRRTSFNSIATFNLYLRSAKQSVPLNLIDTDPVGIALKGSLASFVQHLQAMAQPFNQSGSAFEVAAGYHEALTPTAFADWFEGCHIVGIHTGLAVTVQEFCLFCFAQADFFPSIGKARSETSPGASKGHIPGLWLLTETLKGMRSVPDTAPRIVPVDPERHAAAIYLSILMMRFVWFHELAHGMLGHIDNLRSLSKVQSAEFTELSLMEQGIGAGLIDSQIAQCMEFEADSSALSKCLLIQHNGLENIDGIKAMPSAVRMRLTLFGIYAMTWLFETFQAVLYRRKFSVTHPAPLTRLKMLQNMAVWELDDIKADTANITKDALGQLLSILPRLGQDWQSIDGFEPAQYRQTFEEMRETLAPFRYLVPE